MFSKKVKFDEPQTDISFERLDSKSRYPSSHSVYTSIRQTFIDTFISSPRYNPPEYDLAKKKITYPIHVSAIDYSFSLQSQTGYIPETTANSIKNAIKLSLPDKLIKKTKKIDILNSVWCEFQSKKLHAIVGTSGSGKTSLLNVLSGRIKAKTDSTHVIKGHISHGGTIITESNRRAMRFVCGYVAQDDLIMNDLTVYENIMFSANCRLPYNITKETKIERVNKLIKDLRLQRCRDRCISSMTLQERVSGGERKRCSIAMEMVTQPRILFLDEPTTGLDSTTSFYVLKLLKKISANTTVILSIHQPRSSIWHMLDYVTIVNDHQVIRQLPPEDLLNDFTEIGYHCEEFDNPADFVLDTLNNSELAEQAHNRLLSRHQLAYREKRGKITRNRKSKKSKDQTVVQVNQLMTDGFFTEKKRFQLFMYLSKRSMIDYRRNYESLALNAFVSIVISFLVGILYREYYINFRHLINFMRGFQRWLFL